MKRTILFSGVLLAGLMVMVSPESRAGKNPFNDKLDKTLVQDTTNVRKNDRMKKSMPSETDTSKWHKDHKKNWQDSTGVHKDHMMKDTTKTNKKKW